MVITPVIRSIMATSPGRSDMPTSPEAQCSSTPPRAGNRTLISWGFNSTSFTAEPLMHSSQWSVTVEKNTSKIGNINSGYLFGVGIAHDTLGSKDQVCQFLLLSRNNLKFNMFMSIALYVSWSCHVHLFCFFFFCFFD